MPITPDIVGKALAAFFHRDRPPDAQITERLRAALEAVEPLIIRDAMAECALELRAKGCHDIARVFTAYANGIETVLAKEPQ